MAFSGTSFTFDGISCEEFDLMLYGIDGNTQSETTFASTVSIEEENISTRWKPYFYGAKFEKKLSFNLVFGVNMRRIDERRFLDRIELDTIAAWLTGHREYKWLEIAQDDLYDVRYRCIITELKTVDIDGESPALSATVECDGPYAYLLPESYAIDVHGEKDIILFNKSSMNDLYKPFIKITKDGGNIGMVSIKNETDGGTTMVLDDIPTSVTEITIDCDHQIVTNNMGYNLYNFFNFKYLRLKRGDNRLKITGDCKIEILCEFPVNPGT